MKRALTALVATATLGAMPIVLTGVPAEAANKTPNCITRAEFGAVKKNATLKQVRRIIGATGRVSSQNDFSDGDGWKTVEFRQCGRSWTYSSVSISFQKSEREVYVPDVYCYSDGTCEDYGTYETRYSNTYVVTSKSAYWF